MRKIILVLVFMLVSIQSWAVASSFEDASQAYFEKRYNDALMQFETLSTAIPDNGYLTYNLGNVYFKMGKLGLARLYYERAERLMPREKDLNFNLELVKNSLKDDVGESFRDYLRRTFFFWVAFLNLSEIAIVVIVLTVFFWTIQLVKLWRGKRFITPGFVFFGLVYIYGLAGFYIKGVNESPGGFGIVVADNVPVKSSYLDQDKPLFELHEATKVKIIDKQGFGVDQNWLRIMLPQGQKGWIKAENLRVI